MSPRTHRKVIRLTGELDFSRREEISRAMSIDGSEASVLVDFFDVTYADSTALSEMLRFRNDAERERVPVAVVIGSKQFARLIDYAGLAHAFEIFGDRAKALSYLSGAEAR